MEILAIVWHGLLLLLQVALLLPPPPPGLGKARSLIGVLGAETAAADVLLVGSGHCCIIPLSKSQHLRFRFVVWGIFVSLGRIVG